MSLKLIINEGQLPKGMLTPELPGVLNTLNGMYYPLGEGKLLKENKEYVPRIPMITIDRQNRVVKFLSVLTGINNDISYPKTATFRFIKDLKNGSHTNNFYLSKHCDSFHKLYDHVYLWNSLRDLHENGVKYSLKKFDTKDRASVLRTTTISGAYKDLTGYICIVNGNKGGLKGIVKVVEHNGSTIKLETLGLAAGRLNNAGFLIPVHHYSKLDKLEVHRETISEN